MSLPRPNLFLIGSMKSGTTHLSELLGAHPAIFMSSPKEPCHFVDGRALHRQWPYMWRQGYWRSLDRYLALFANARDARVIGEASTVYSHAPSFGGVPERILAFNPQARFIYIMRDPVERTISHYWHQVRWASERRPILAALRADSRYTDVSHYARQLQEFLRHVGLDRIYTLTYESLLADPARELRLLYGWLGVDPNFRPDDRIGVPVNERPDIIEQMRSFGLLDGLVERMRRTVPYITLSSHVPAGLRRLGTALMTHQVHPADVPVAETQEFLRSRQQRQTEELGTLLKRSFPEWRTLHAGAEVRGATRFESARLPGATRVATARYSSRNGVSRSQ